MIKSKVVRLRICGAFVLSIIFSWVLLSGCTSAIKVQKMIPENIAIVKQHFGKVVLQVDGGREEHPVGWPQISNDNFMIALKSAVQQSNIFTEVSEDKRGDYRLEAFIFNLVQPLIGYNWKVHLEIAWTLSRLDTKTVLWQDSIITSSTAEKSGSIGFMSKVKFATEAAAKANIKTALERLSRIGLLGSGSS